MLDRTDDELIAELRGLSPELAVPEAADQRAAVRRRLTRPVARPRRLRVVVAAVVAAVCGTVVAVAPARAAVVDAVSDLLRVAGIELSRSQSADLPPTPGPLPSQGSAALDEARGVALFPLRVPAAFGAPERVLLADPDPAGAPRVVTLVYRGGTVRLDEFDGAADPAFFKSAPDAEFVELNGELAVWLPAPHAVTYIGRDGVARTETARLATPTLIWTAGGTVTYRLEGLTSVEEARRVALSMR